MAGDWIDISTPLQTGMRHWPGDPDVVVEQARLEMHPHTGTHVDAPRHFIPDGITMDGLPFPALMGQARVVELGAFEAGMIPQGARVLFKGATDEGITVARAQVLVQRTALCVGIDSLSIGNEEVHRTVFGGGIWVIEGLDLRDIEPGDWELLCLPLRIAGGDGAPARALLRRLS